jgi:hypothetical protein
MQPSIPSKGGIPKINRDVAAQDVAAGQINKDVAFLRSLSSADSA